MKIDSPERIGKAISVTFPELGDIRHVLILGDGFRSLVVETPQGEIFKIAKNWQAAAGYTKEFQLLPLIRSRLTLPVPYPVWRDGGSKHFPFGVLGYPKLPGAPLKPGTAPPDLARDVAAFMQALHAIDLTGDITASVPEPRAYWDELERLRNTLAPALRELLEPQEYRIIHRWWGSLLEDPSMHDFQPVLHHGDFWHGNMLVDEHTVRLSAIVDFEHTAAGDPAQDVATLLHLGRPFVLAVLHEYETAGGILDAGVRYRAQKLWELREFTGIGFAIQTTNQQEFDEAVRKLRNGPLLNEATRRETQLWPPQRG